jgi:hypothetical protein
MYIHSRVERKGLSKLNCRLWFHKENSNRSNCIELGYSLESRPFVSFKIKSGSDNDVTIGISFFVYFYLCFNLPKKWMEKFTKSLPQYEYDREIRLSIHHYSIWWNFWTSDGSLSSTTPKYRKGCFDVSRFLLGDWKTDIKIIEEAQYNIYTDTGSNNIILQKELFTKYRNKWYCKWFKFKFIRWNYEYGIIEDCKESDVDCYCRLKGTLKFDYTTVKDNYEKLIYLSMKGARKLKWDCDETQGGSFYDKELKDLDTAYLHLVGNIYKDKLKHSQDQYKKNEEVR